VLFRSLSFN